jgi:hypothetical protein
MIPVGVMRMCDHLHAVQWSCVLCTWANNGALENACGVCGAARQQVPPPSPWCAHLGGNAADGYLLVCAEYH